MKRPTAAFAFLALGLLVTGCRATPDTRGESQSSGPTHDASIDSVVQFLLTAAASDFHGHSPPDPARFRDVRLGRVPTSSGAAQYMLCGQFLPAQEEGAAAWTPFATIKTSDYEQWIGASATGFCQGPSVTWEDVGDLSGSLQSRLDSLR